MSGPDLAVSREHAEKIFAKLREMPELRDVQFAQTLDYPSVNVDVNRERAGLLGVKVTDVTRALVAATTSSRFTQPIYWNDPKTGVSYSLQVQIPQTLTKSVEDLRNVPVDAGEKSVLLRNVANISQGTSVGQYERYNMARVVSITANLYRADLGSVARKIEKVLAEIGAPPAKTNVALRGQIIPLNELLDGFRSGLIVAVVVIFLLLVANFQSLRLALAVVSTVPAVLAGVVLMLWLTRTTLNIQSAIGAIMAVGVAVANAILLVTFAERAHRAHRAGVLTVPVDALAMEKTNAFVFKIGDGRAKKTAVTLGFNDAVSVEIATGLNEGEPVILVGKTTFSDGQAVRLEEGK